MFSKKKETVQIDAAQQALYEHARKRIVQKKRLFQHFVIFVVGALLLILLNLVLGVGKDITLLGIDWFVFAVVLWAFLLIIHSCNVWLFTTFMGKEWTDRQMERLIAKQKKEIAALEEEVAMLYPTDELLKKKAAATTTDPKIDPKLLP